MLRDTRRTAMGWGSYQVNERRRQNRYYLQIILTHHHISEGWITFYAVAAEARNARVDPDRLVYRTHRVTPIGVTTVFEVVP